MGGRRARALRLVRVAELGLSVSLRRSGGLLPGQVLETFVREEDLEPGRAKELREMVAAADPEALASRSPIRGPGADMYQYEVVVDTEKRRSRIVSPAAPCLRSSARSSDSW